MTREFNICDMELVFNVNVPEDGVGKTKIAYAKEKKKKKKDSG